jgi:hypothetical protein
VFLISHVIFVLLFSSIAVGGGEQYGENCEVFDCSNTISAYTGDRCGAFSTPTLRSAELVEYMYEAKWPCADGCNLCGEGGRMTMGNNNFSYPSTFLSDNVTIECYALQYDAFIGGLSEGDYCQTIPPLVEDLCGCEVPPTEAPAEISSDPPAETPTAGSPTVTPPMPTGAAPSIIKNGMAMAGILAAATIVWVW